MKIAVLADIHANYPALLAVLDHLEHWQPDRVIVAGDIVNRGPRPAEVLRLIRRKQSEEGWLILKGNHEDYVLFHNHPDAPHTGPLFEIYRYSYWTYQRLHDHIPYLRGLPDEITEQTAGGEVRAVHASMRDNRTGIYPEMTDRLIARLIHPAPALMLVGHTHRPLIRTIGRCLVVNVGSVGLPFDGDRRAAYAQVTYQGGRWQARIVRLDYDSARTEHDFIETGFLEQAGPLARLILLELRLALSQLYCWTEKYHNAVLKGEISMEESVRRYLQEPITHPYWHNLT